VEIIKYKIPLSSGGFDQVTLLKARLDIQGEFGRIMRTLMILQKLHFGA